MFCKAALLGRHVQNSVRAQQKQFC